MLTARDVLRSDEDQYRAAADAMLATREAKCSCGETLPSSRRLAFFEFRGAGSDISNSCDECGMNAMVHWPVNPYTGRPGRTDHEFRPRPPMPHDTFYCGCRGWD